MEKDCIGSDDEKGVQMERPMDMLFCFSRCL